MSSEMCDEEILLLLKSLPEGPAPPMPQLGLPPRPALAPPLPTWVFWCVGASASFTLAAGGLTSWWLVHGGIGVVIGELAALSVRSIPFVTRGLSVTDALLVGTLLALVLSPRRTFLTPPGS